MKKRTSKPMTLREFSVRHGQTLVDGIDIDTQGYAIHTGVPSLPNWYWVTDDTYKQLTR